MHLTGDDIYLISSYDKFKGHGSTELYITGKDTVFVHGNFYPNPQDFTITNYKENSYNFIQPFNLQNIYSYNINIPFEKNSIDYKNNIVIYFFL